MLEQEQWGIFGLLWPTLLKSDVRLHCAGWADDMVCMRHIQRYPFTVRLF